jgi:alanine dehydrogenase
LIVGVPQETAALERRVSVVPETVPKFGAGVTVVVETGAGTGSAFADADYERVGARIAGVDEVWASADLLLKVKEPVSEEYGRLREGLTLFTYLHLAADEPLTRALAESGTAAVAYETVETAPARCRCSRRCRRSQASSPRRPARTSSRSRSAGAGSCSAAVPGVAPGGVVIIGGGSSATTPRSSLGLGAQVTILERSLDRMRHLEVLSGRVTLLMSSALQSPGRRSRTPTS